jgi:protease I
MRFVTTLLAALILLCLGTGPTLAQYYDGYSNGYYDDGYGNGYYDDGYSEGYTCWMCPNCGFVVLLDVQVSENAVEYQTTLGEVLEMSPYDSDNYCPLCGEYGAYFVLVPCSDYYGEGEGYEGYEDDGYYEENENGEYYGGEEECSDEEYVDEWEDDTAIDDNETETAFEPLTGYEEIADTTAPASGKILIVVPSKDFNDVEFTATKSVFLDEGFEVDVASKGTEEALGMEGAVVAVGIEVADADVSDYEAVVFIGGPGVDDLLLYEDPDYLSLAGSARDQDVIVGAICVAPKILANAWLLGGRKATVFPDSESIAYIKSKGATYSDEQVERDGRIITASGPEASEEFAEAVAAAVKES